MNTLTKLSLLTLFLPCLVLLRTFHNKTFLKPISSKPRHAQTVPFVNTLCHTDPGLNIRASSTPTGSNCYGSCANATQKTILLHAIEAPRISSLCLSNPFHAFYDCIWPLVHYISTCLPLRSARPLIITNNEVLSHVRKNRWAVRAQTAYLSTLQARTMEKHRVPHGKCICFKHLVTFRRAAFFRPIRFQYRIKMRNSSVIASHASLMKRDGLQSFRHTVLKALNLSLILHTPRSPILVYGREDASRRRWTNINQFITMLQLRLPKDATVTKVSEMPKSFEQQASMFNGAAMVIAPHGAAMVNTLFMKAGTAVLEIASRKCLTAGDEQTFEMDVVEDVNDENTWMPWHAQSLGLYHMSVVCFLTHTGNGDFETDNDSLTKLALLLLNFPRKRT